MSKTRILKHTTFPFYLWRYTGKKPGLVVGSLKTMDLSLKLIM